MTVPDNRTACENGCTLSVVIPAFNEAESLPELFQEIVAALEPGLGGRRFEYEVILVDDGSTDGTREVCAKLDPLVYARLPYNQGQTAALQRGFELARGEFVAALDADGQNDPADIPRMMERLLDSDLDAVCGWRTRRRDPLGKRIASRGAYALRMLLLGDRTHDSGCTLKVFRRSCLEGLVLTSQQHRFIPALLARRGFKVGEMPVNHRARAHGRTKYGARRMVDGLRDLLAIRHLPEAGENG